MSLFQVTKKQVIENYELRTMTGDIVSFTPSYSQLLPDPFSDLNVTVNIEATGGNGTPDNPIPINGYTEANIVNTQNESIADLFSIDSNFRGTVAFNQLVRFENTAKQGLTATMDANNVVSVSGTATSAWSNITYPIEPIDNHKYFIGRTIIANPNNISLYWGFLNVNQTPRNPDLVSSGSSYNIVNINSHTGSSTGIANIESGTDFTGFKFKLICIDLTAMFGSTIADYIYGLEQSTAGAGVAFFRSIYPDDYYSYDLGTKEIVGKETPEAVIPFGQTVYGGVLDLTRGKLHVTRRVVDMGTLYWTYNTQFQVFRADISNCILNPAVNSDHIPMCSIYEGIKPNYATVINNAQIMYNVGGAGVYVKDTSYTDTSDFTTAMNGVQLVHELATPFDIDLTPEVISAIVGTNNVFADCGETTVTCLI